MKSLLLLALGLALVGCQTVQSVSINQIPDSSQRTHKVLAEASSPIILLVPFATSYIDEANAELQEKCPAPGKIEGVLSKHTRNNYFLGLVVSQKVEFSGYCVKSGQATTQVDTKGGLK